jgi:V/A-type H+-transporting ATPase subunit I
MLKVTAFVHGSAVEEAVERLRAAGVLDIVSDEHELPAPVAIAEQERLAEFDEDIANAEFVVTFLGKYHESDAPFSAFISEKIHLSEDEFVALRPGESFDALYRECVELSDRLATMGRQRVRLTRLIQDLEPWRGLHLQISGWKGTENVVLFTGTVQANESDAIRQLLRDAVAEVSVEELGAVGSRAAWVVMAHRGALEEVRATLNLTSFTEVAFPELSDYPAEEIALARDEIEQIDADRDRLLEHAKLLSDNEYVQAVSLAESLGSARDTVSVRDNFGSTERTVVMGGWVSESNRPRLEDAMGSLGGLADLTFREAGGDDNPPVQLENPRWLKPLETLTDLYGRPQYVELDPTPLLAPFFLLFFGICIGDVGYGLMIIAGAYMIKNKLDVAPGVKKFMDLLMMGGVSAIVIGIVTGSYFAIATEQLPAFLQALALINPMVDLTQFLLIMIGLGVVQVFFGVLVAAYDAARRGDASSAVNDQLSTILLAAMITVSVLVPGASLWAIVIGLGVVILMKGHAIEAALFDAELPGQERLAGGVWLTVFVAWILSLAFGGPALIGWGLLGLTALGLFASKGVRRTVVAFLGGAYAVYSMTGFISDILSYSRLAALGLSGMLVGSVFNLLAGMVWSGSAGLFAKGGFSLVGGVLLVVMATLIFVVGHVFNVVINLLSAFVHPARLQFIEFFSKFYQGGGRGYAPFGYRTKALVLHAQGVQQEGGTES